MPELTEEERIALCEAAEVLRTFFLNGFGGPKEREAREICLAIHRFMVVPPVPVVSPTWESA